MSAGRLVGMQNHLDPIVIASNAIAATVGALVGIPISAAAADAMGVYAVIAICAAIGAGWALGDREQSTRLSAIWYFTRVTVTSAMLTFVVASYAAKWLGLDSERWLLIIVAFGLGLIGDNWGKVRDWLGLVVRRFTTSKTGNQE